VSPKKRSVLVALPTKTSDPDPYAHADECAVAVLEVNEQLLFSLGLAVRRAWAAKKVRGSVTEVLFQGPAPTPTFYGEELCHAWGCAQWFGPASERARVTAFFEELSREGVSPLPAGTDLSRFRSRRSREAWCELAVTPPEAWAEESLAGANLSWLVVPEASDYHVRIGPVTPAKLEALYERHRQSPDVSPEAGYEHRPAEAPKHRHRL
jgi:hypothetical protein